MSKSKRILFILIGIVLILAIAFWMYAHFSTNSKAAQIQKYPIYADMTDIGMGLYKQDPDKLILYDLTELQNDAQFPYGGVNADNYDQWNTSIYPANIADCNFDIYLHNGIYLMIIKNNIENNNFIYGSKDLTAGTPIFAFARYKNGIDLTNNIKTGTTYFGTKTGQELINIFYPNN